MRIHITFVYSLSITPSLVVYRIVPSDEDLEAEFSTSIFDTNVFRNEKWEFVVIIDDIIKFAL
jgi:hypothetical protein